MGSDAGNGKTVHELMSGTLPSPVFILIEDDEYLTIRLFAELRQLRSCQMSAESAGGIAKACLPKQSQIEQTLCHDYGGEVPDRLPGEESAFGSHQGDCYPAYRAVNHYVYQRVRVFLRRRHKVPSLGTAHCQRYREDVTT
jgi:hypothetical protein